jgi:hypothetical protein
MPTFDANSPKPNATINTPQRSPMLPTWLPDAGHRDAALAVSHPAETDGEYTQIGQDGSRPHLLENQAPAAHAESDSLHSTARPAPRRHPY